MKKLFAVLLSALLLLSSIGCNAAPAENEPCSEENDGDVFDCMNVQVGYWMPEEFIGRALNYEMLDSREPLHLPIFKMESRAELDTFLDDCGEYLDTEQLRTAAWLDDTYFEAFTMLIVYKPSGSSSYTYGIKRHDLGSDRICLYIEQTNDPEDCDMSMSGWFLCLSIDKHIAEGVTSFDAIFEEKE